MAHTCTCTYFDLKGDDIVHPESFRSNSQNTIAFACVYLRSHAFAFAFVCEYCSYIYTQLGVA